MVSKLNKHKRIIFTVTVLVFVISIFFGLGNYVGSINLKNAVATVGDAKIPYDRYEIQVRLMMDNILKDQDVGEGKDVVEKMVRNEVFKNMIVDELLYEEAKNLNIDASDFEVAVEIENTQQFWDNGRFNPQLYVTTIWRNFRMSPKEYEQWRKKQRIVNKYKQFLYYTVKVTDDDLNFYSSLIPKDKLPKEKSKLTDGIKQQKFLAVANYYLREITSKVEIKDYRKKFEQDNS